MMQNIVEENRIGEFFINCKVIRDNPQNALAALEGCIVIHAETIHSEGEIKYTAYHKDFYPRDQYDEPIQYSAYMQKVIDNKGQPKGRKRVWLVV